jgi:flavin reductase (DIM6/NTAB) family NADH-FMN oxidoreductase RutF
MKKLLNILLFGQSFFKEYPAVSIDENAIGEKVVFEIGGTQSDVSQKHWLLSLEPIIFGIWVDGNANYKDNGPRLLFNSKQGKTLAVLDLNLTDSISEKEGALFLFEVQKSKLFYLNPLKTYLIFLLHYKKPSQSFDQFKNLAAAFSYPRKVRLISFKQGDYFNIFPMDLVGAIPQTNRFAFGLRHTNSTLGQIILAKKIVAAEFPSSLKKDVYRLSNHHSVNPPSTDSLSFKTILTQSYDFPIPETAMKYYEIEITKTINLGSHMLLWGESINTVSLNQKEDNLFHIHFLNYLSKKHSDFQCDVV